MDKFDTKKIFFYLSGILVFIILIMIVLSINPKEQVEKNTPTQSKIYATTDNIKQSPEKTENIQTITNIKSPIPSKKREDSWKSDGTGYLSLSQTYRKAFVKAVNNNDMTEIELMLVTGSDIYKKITEQINGLNKQKVQLDFKLSTLINFSETGNEITLEVSENIGIKDNKETKFTYKDYNVKYTFLVDNQGLLITNVVDGI